AINLDGGGSTTMWLRGKGIINHPSDNKKFDHEGARAIRTAVIVTLNESTQTGNISSNIQWRAQRSPANPLIVPNMPGLTGRAGQNINGPSVIRVPGWIQNPLGRYYMYFSHHRDSYIRLAYADSPEGPWKIHAPGTLRLEETSARDHIASPDVHIDEARKEIRMYFHGVHPTDSKQVTWVATSKDGLQFDASPEILGWFYFRVFEHDGWHYAIAKKGNEAGILYRSRDGLTGFEEGPDIIRNMRHVAVYKRGNTLDVFYSRIGDAPESILHSTMSLEGDWKTWTSSEPTLVLAPDEPYEGSDLPISPSTQGQARHPVRQLRDPAFFEEQGRYYLYYSIAGEQGIAVAELTKIPRSSNPTE
ncbi:MAG: phosphodiester glycosidase family protein, partial [Limisphaerales bacterium]